MQATGTYNVDERQDLKRIEAISRKRDRKAFDELFERHQRAAYSLALHITGDPEAAEENVQEAMLKVWLSASTFRAEGTVRSWLLRIVARESLKSIKSARRKQTAMDLDFDQLPTSAAVEDPAENELSQALREKMQTLPVLERQLIGLHYGGGLTQQEIGETLSMPQQTVSYKLNEAIKILRANLKTAGFAAAAPLLESGKLFDALCGGHAAPATLQAKVSAAVSAKAAHVSTRRSQRTNRSTRSSTRNNSTNLLLAGAAAAVICVVAFAALNKEQPAVAVKSAVPAAVPSPAPLPIAVKPAEEAPQYMNDLHLLFKEPAPKDILTAPEWKWNAKLEAMECSNNNHVIMPLALGPEPIHITMKVKYYDIKKTMNIGFSIYHSQTARELRALEVYSAHHTQNVEEFTNDVYIFGPYVAEFMNDLPARLVKYDTEHKGHYLVALINNLFVKEFWLRRISEKDLPKSLSDLPALKAALEHQPQFEK